MCGLAGIVFPGDPAGAPARLRRMLAAQRHRGPDGSGTHLEPAAALGHVRLALLDPGGGAQPLRDPTGRYVLVYNGEIYNHLRLRPRLDYPFRTRCDAETLLAALLAWGPAALDELDGMFAFFLWDRAARRGLAARDALGVKPFVYQHERGELRFASELKGLLAAGLPPRLRQEAVVEYLLAPGLSGVREPLCEGASYLPAGWSLTIDEAGLRAGPWYRYGPPAGGFLPAGEETTAALRSALRGAVQGTLLADTPLGVLLSGGLDSTAIAALAAEVRPGLPALTITFEDQARYDYARSRIVVSDDTPYALLAAAALPGQIDHRLVPAPRAELLAALPALAADNDRLPAWEQELAQRALFRAAAAWGLKALLVGDCADETHYGYFFLLADEVVSSPAGLLRLFGPEVRLGCLRRELRAEEPLRRLAAAYGALCAEAGLGFGDPTAGRLAATHLIVRLWLGRLLHNGDVHSMAASVEARVPFAARPLIDLARRIHPDLAFRAGREKHALREAVRPLVPAAIYRRKKSALPKDQLLGPLYQAALRPLLADPEEAAFLGAWLDLQALGALCARPGASLDENERALLFNVLGLVHWRRAYL